MKNYYHILEVNRFATDAQIKQAYRRLALKYHPDKNPGSPQAHKQFIEIQEAYSVLSVAYKRLWYDEQLFAPPPPVPKDDPANPVSQFDPRARPQDFVRRENPMNAFDKQIFFGGITAFTVILLGLLWIFMHTRPDPNDPNTLTDWAIREPDGRVRQLTRREFDSLLQEFNLQPGQVRELIDSLRAAGDQ